MARRAAKGPHSPAPGSPDVRPLAERLALPILRPGVIPNHAPAGGPALPARPELPITRASIAAFQAFRAADGWARKTLAQHLSAPEVQGLLRLVANLERCGDPKTWWPRQGKGSGQISAAVLDRLLAGLHVRENAFRDFVRACRVGETGGPLGAPMLLEEALRQRLEPIWKAQAAGDPPRRDPMALKQEVTAEVDRRKLDLRERVPSAVCREIAEKLDCSPSCVSGYVSTLRRERGIPTPALPTKASSNGHSQPNEPEAKDVQTSEPDVVRVHCLHCADQGTEGGCPDCGRSCETPAVSPQRAEASEAAEEPDPFQASEVLQASIERLTLERDTLEGDLGDLSRQFQDLQDRYQKAIGEREEAWAEVKEHQALAQQARENLAAQVEVKETALRQLEEAAFEAGLTDAQRDLALAVACGAGSDLAEIPVSRRATILQLAADAAGLALSR